jgi:hypothetical protein
MKASILLLTILTDNTLYLYKQVEEDLLLLEDGLEIGLVYKARTSAIV